MTKDEIDRINNQACTVMDSIRNSKYGIPVRHTMLYLMCENIKDLCEHIAKLEKGE